MSDDSRTRDELLRELHSLRRRIAELEAHCPPGSDADLLRSAFDRAPIGVAIIDGEGRLVQVNRRLCEILGFDSAELVGRDVMELTCPDDVPESRARGEELRAGRIDTLTLEKRYLRKDGSMVWGSVKVTALPEAPGREERFIAFVEDVTARKAAEVRLRWTQFAVDHVSVAAFWMGSDGRLIYVNQAACRSLGYTREELLGMTVHDIDPDFPASVWPDHWREVRRHGSLTIESHHRTKDGRVFPVRITANYVQFEGREYNIAFAEDISRQKQQEQARRESEERFGNIVQASPMGIHMYRLDEDGRLIFIGANPAADRILGVDNSRFIGKPMEEAFPGIVGTEVPEAYRRACIDGTPWKTEQIDYEDEHIRGAYEVHAFQTSPGMMAAMFLDITDRKRAEAERHRLEEQLRQAQKMEAVGELAGGIAHDFNNVLTAIQGNAELLRAVLAEGSDAGEYAEEILKASRRAADLTKQLLAFARKGRFESAVVDVHELVREATGMLTHGIDRRIEIRLELDAPRPFVRGDASQLQSALLNLGLNARDAMPEGGTLTYATRRVHLDADDARAGPYEIAPGPYVEISVTDTGIGMDRDLQQRIFEPFFTTKRRGKGTGLGLAGVYGCIKSHGGGIRVYSEPGEGSTFRVLLPLAPDAPAPAPPAEEQAPVHGAGHVMVVDDEEMVRGFAAAALRELGYTVTTCADGAEAVERYRESPDTYDLLILDLIMPRLNGAETFARLRQIDPQVKVLIASGFSHNGTADELLAAGALGFLHKPFRVEDLSRAVATHLPADRP